MVKENNAHESHFIIDAAHAAVNHYSPRYDLDPENIASDVVLAILKCGETYDRSQGTGFIYKVTRNKITDRLRKKKPITVPDPAVLKVQGSIEGVIDGSKEKVTLVRQAINETSSTYTRRRLMGLTIEQLEEEEEDISIDAVKSRIRREKNKIREYLLSKGYAA